MFFNVLERGEKTQFSLIFYVSCQKTKYLCAQIVKKWHKIGQGQLKMGGEKNTKENCTRELKVKVVKLITQISKYSSKTNKR